MKLGRNLTLACAVAWTLLAAPIALAQSVHGYIVQLKPSAQTVGRESAQAASERARGVAQDTGLSAHPLRAISAQLHHVQLSAPLAHAGLAEASLRRLRLHPDVLSVEPDVMQRPMLTPNDTSFARLWHLQAPSSTGLSAINATGAWDFLTGSRVVVAVLDSGTRPHPDLAGKILSGYDFVSELDYANDGNGRDADPTDPGDFVSTADKTRSSSLYSGCDVRGSSWHGTFIAGLIGAAANNGQGVAGISWGAEILPVRVAGKCGALLSDLLDGMRWAAGLSVAGAPINPNPARIINVSFGGSTGCAGSAYQPVIDEVTAAGALVVVAAGNEAGPPTRPADCAHVVSVGAVRADGMKTSYSNFGAAVTLVAPGGSTEGGGINLLYGLVNTGSSGPVSEGFGVKQGTSFSAPVVAGVAALMLSANPLLTPAELTAKLKLSARPFEFNPAFPSCSPQSSAVCNCNINLCGAGMLDAVRAVQQALIPVAKIAPVRVITNGAAQLPPGPINAASLILLDARPSIVGTNQSIGAVRWQQLSGPVASIAQPTSITTSVALSLSLGTVVFELRVTDAAGRISEDRISLNTVAATTPGFDPIITPPATPSSGGGAIGLLEILLLALTSSIWAFKRLQKRKITI